MIRAVLVTAAVFAASLSGSAAMKGAGTSIAAEARVYTAEANQGPSRYYTTGWLTRRVVAR